MIAYSQKKRLIRFFRGLQSSGHKALKADVVKQSSDVAIANPYHYLQRP